MYCFGIRSLLPQGFEEGRGGFEEEVDGVLEERARESVQPVYGVLDQQKRKKGEKRQGREREERTRVYTCVWEGAREWGR